MRVEHGADVSDRDLLQKLERMCPPRISMLEDFETDWNVIPVPKDINTQNGALIASTIDCSIGDDWHEVTLSGSQVMQKHSVAAAKEAQNAALGIQKELHWYFQERDSRILGFRRDPVKKACARTVFARKLLRFVASSLHSADENLLEAWCMYLRAIVEDRTFSSSNIIWTSRFDRSLEACLARLERVLVKVKKDDFPELSVCPVDQHVVARATERCDMVGTTRCGPERLVLWRQLTKVDKVLTKVQTYCPLALPGLETAALFNSWTASIVFTSICLEVLAQLAGELHAYSTGEIDGRTFAEDMLVASGSAGAFALGRYTSAFLCVGEGAIAFLADQFGAGAAAFFMGIILRAAGREMHGGARMRALRNAHASLGLNPSGVWTYSPQEIETQLECRLRRRGRTERSTLRLWAAYAYIREHQYPELTDPWRHVSAVWEGVANLNYQEACEILDMNSESGFTAIELRRRYLQKALSCHPDKPTGDQQTFMRLHGAYEFLGAFCRA